MSIHTHFFLPIQEFGGIENKVVDKHQRFLDRKRLHLLHIELRRHLVQFFSCLPWKNVRAYYVSSYGVIDDGYFVR